MTGPNTLARTTLLLAVLGGCGDPLPVDTDTDTSPVAPMVNLIGEWWLPSSARLPTQSESWCADLTPERFDDSECFTEPTSCTQGVTFDTPNGERRATWRVIIEGSECGTDLPTTVYASSQYGYFEWLGRTEDGSADRYRVNARLWVVDELGNDEVVVESVDQTWTMVEDYRWP